MSVEKEMSDRIDEEKGRAYSRMVIGVSIIDIHVLEEPFDVLVEEALDLSIIEFGINEEGTDVRFHDIRESLRTI